MFVFKPSACYYKQAVLVKLVFFFNLFVVCSYIHIRSILLIPLVERVLK